MATYTFVKKGGAPAGSIVFGVGGLTHVIDDSSNPQIVTSNEDVAGVLKNSPYLTLQGQSGTYTPPPIIQDVFVADGVLSTGVRSTPTPLGGLSVNGGTNRGTFTASTAYKANDQIVNAGVLYAANADFTSGASFSAANWTPLPGFIQDGGTAFAVAAGAWNTVATGGSAGGSQNTTGFRIFLTIRAGVVANPGQNGHIYLEIAPNNNGGALPTTGWVTMDYIATRNNQATGTGGTGVVAADASALVGAGKGLVGIIGKNYWYRLRTFIVPSYAAPTYVLDGSTPGFFQTIT